MHPDWFRILKKAGELGFSHVQCATNGLKFAQEPDFAEKSREAGLHTLYLQFDGLDPAMYETTRGRKDLLDIKMQAIENVRKAGLKIVYVPTIVGGLNRRRWCQARTVRFLATSVPASAFSRYQ